MSVLMTLFTRARLRRTLWRAPLALLCVLPFAAVAAPAAVPFRSLDGDTISTSSGRSPRQGRLASAAGGEHSVLVVRVWYRGEMGTTAPVESLPTTPVDPTSPTTPVDPTSPTSPTTPVDPTSPTSPTTPVDPTSPTTPTTPVDPTTPTTPGLPATLATTVGPYDKYSVEQVQQRVTGGAQKGTFADVSAAAMFQAQGSEVGANVVTLTGAGGAPQADVTDWVELPGLMPQGGPNGCLTDTVRQSADAKLATLPGHPNPAAYDHVMYLFPFTAKCAFAGLAQAPGRLLWIDGFSPYPNVRDTETDGSVVFHELGHNLGMLHAASVPCTTTQDAVNVRFAVAGCTRPRSAADSTPALGTEEYGDPFDAMGTEGYVFSWRGSELMSTWRRSQLNQLPADRQHVVTAPGTYRIAAAGHALASGSELLRIPRGSAAYTLANGNLGAPEGALEGGRVYPDLTLEVRTASAPFDQWTLDPAGANALRGVLVRIAPDIGSIGRTFLLDGTPETGQQYLDPASTSNQSQINAFYSQYRNAWRDAAVPAGRTFIDALSGIKVRIDAVDSDGATVTVSGGPYGTTVVPPTTPPSTGPQATTPTKVQPTTPTTLAPTPTVLYPVLRGNTRTLTKARRIVVSVAGAGQLDARLAGRSLGRRSGERGSWTVPRSAVRQGLIRVTASGGSLASPVTATLTIRRGRVTVRSS